MAKEINLDKHIWEGWRVRDFINELQPTLDYLYNEREYNCSPWVNKPFSSKAAMREYCKDNQPYYKKHIPEVCNYFIQRYNIK